MPSSAKTALDWDADIINSVLSWWMHTSPSIHWNGEAYVFGPLQEEQRVKDTMIWLNKMYTAGLIDPEYEIMTSDQRQTKMLDNTYTLTKAVTSTINPMI